MPPELLSTSIRVRFAPTEKRELEQLADRAGVTMARALREGIRLYLQSAIGAVDGSAGEGGRASHGS